MVYLHRVLLVLAVVCSSMGFQVFNKHSTGNTILRASTWQEDLDQILNIDTPCDARRSLSQNIVQKFSDITNDIISAVQDKNIEKIAPKSLAYGKAVAGFQTFQNQILTDVIPDFLTKGIPLLVDEGPKLINQLIERGPSEWVETGQKAVEQVREITSDPSMLQSTVDDLRREIRNIVRSTPEGLDSPYYDVLARTENFEVRKYAPFSVISTTMTSNNAFEEAAYLAYDPLQSSSSFTQLVKYIFGENIRETGGSERLSMTTPVITDATSMSFVLPRNLDALSAPIPKSERVLLKDLPAEIVAAREFTGLVTEGEISRQKAKLEDALIAAGIVYEPATFKVLQYNPPYTLPWIRRNEITVVVEYKSDIVGSNNVADSSRSLTQDVNTYFSAPEAGD